MKKPGQKLATKAWLASLDEDETLALRSWVGESKPFREYQLTGNGGPGIARLTAALERALDRAEPYRGGVVLRGLRNLSEYDLKVYQPEAVYSLDSLQSGTKSMAVAMRFTRSQAGKLAVLIEVRNNLTAVAITEREDGEQEVILRRGAQLRVLDFYLEMVRLGEDEFEIYHVVCEEIEGA